MTLRIAAAALVVALCAGCGGTAVTVSGSDEGGQVTVSSPGTPPIEANIGEGGIQGPPTPTPGPITPIIPIATQVPTRTPRPG